MSLPRLLGQPLARRVLEATLESGRTAGAYLFEGPPGCGKKTAAVDFAAAQVGGERALERAARGLHPDVRLEAPAGASFKVEQIDALLERAAMRPFEGTRKVFILDRAEDLTPAAANRLLKVLEEPPEGLTWILVTTQRAAILDTIASRCQSLRFQPLDEASLRRVLETELSVDARRAGDLAALSGGSVRWAAWIQEPEGQAVLGEAQRYLEIMASGSLVARLDWVESVQAGRRGLDRLLGMLGVLLRERWVIAGGMGPGLRLMHQEPSHGGGLSPEALRQAMVALPRCREALERNGNAALALSAFVLAGGGS